VLPERRARRRERVPERVPVEIPTVPARPVCTTVAAAVTGTPELSTLAAAVAVAGIADDLADPTLVATVLAPNNDGKPLFLISIPFHRWPPISFYGISLI
jgi:hypothetical protein